MREAGAIIVWSGHAPAWKPISLDERGVLIGRDVEEVGGELYRRHATLRVITCARHGGLDELPAGVVRRLAVRTIELPSTTTDELPLLIKRVVSYGFLPHVLAQLLLAARGRPVAQVARWLESRCATLAEERPNASVLRAGALGPPPW